MRARRFLARCYVKKSRKGFVGSRIISIFAKEKTEKQMEQMIIFAASLLPALALLAYVWVKDPQKEPFHLLGIAFLLGIFICLPVSFVEMGIHFLLFGDNDPTTLIGTTAEAFFVAAIPEESFKLLMLWLLLHRNPSYDEHFDGIVYAVYVGLGFATVENILYVFSNIDIWQTVAISRALLAVPGHYAFAVLMGYYYSMYRFVDRTPTTAVCIWLIPVLVHGIYDALAMTGQVDETLGVICFFVLVFFCVKMHKVALRRIFAQLQKDDDEVFVI